LLVASEAARAYEGSLSPGETVSEEFEAVASDAPALFEGLHAGTVRGTYFFPFSGRLFLHDGITQPSKAEGRFSRLPKCRDARTRDLAALAMYFVTYLSAETSFTVLTTVSPDGRTLGSMSQVRLPS